MNPSSVSEMHPMQCVRSLESSFRDRKVLVTGGFGFIGGHLTVRLLELGAQVTVLDLDTRLERPSLINADPYIRERIHIHQGDLSEMPLVQTLFSDCKYEFIFNTASYASVIEKAVDSPYETIRTNTLGLVNILECSRALDNSSRPSRIVHLSTDKVYGNSNGEPYDEEKSALRAEGVYDVAKLASDSFARLYQTAYGLPTAVLRMCNIVGPADYNIRHRIVPKSFARLFEHEDPQSPELYESSLHHSRDYTYIDDCLHAILALAVEPKCCGQVFNLPGSAYLKTPQMMTALIEAAAQVESEHNVARASLIRENGYQIVQPTGLAPITIADQRSTGAKLRDATGFSPRIGIQEGLIRTARWYRDYFENSHANLLAQREFLS